MERIPGFSEKVYRNLGIKNPYIPLVLSEICGYGCFRSKFLFSDKIGFGVKRLGFSFKLRNLS